MNHRVRNMLTVVISIATQTLRQAKSPAAFSDAFLGRVNALAAAYTLISRDNWTAVPLRDVLLEELRPLITEAETMTFDGPVIHLTPKGALAIGMIVHELATNAVKYGSLSVPAGRLAIRWTVEHAEGGGRLVLTWTEQGGPPVPGAPDGGFGRRMIERTLKHELKGDVTMAFRPEGLEATLAMPFEPGIAARPPGQEARS
jgi:two-component system CheB/CheR fusion protein